MYSERRNQCNGRCNVLSVWSGHLIRFRFWHFGEWRDVFVDDRLPTYKGRLIYLHSTNPTEFWAALLEKAYANYEPLHKSIIFKKLTLSRDGVNAAAAIRGVDWSLITGTTTARSVREVCNNQESSGSEKGVSAPTISGVDTALHTHTSVRAVLKNGRVRVRLYGCYESLQGGCTTRALQDLTGGIVQSFGLSNQDRYLTFQVLNSAVPRSSLLISSINQVSGREIHVVNPDRWPNNFGGLQEEKDNKRQLRLRNGLITQHAYSVTGLARVRGPLGETPLVRLRNPWGRGEWTGPWSERSWEWDGLSERDKELLSVRVRNDGEFWMSFEDFARHFTHLDLVHIGPDDWMVEPALHSKQPWRAVLARRRWRSGYNAGGGPGYTETTATNPQFHIQIPRASSNKCHVVVSVTQYYETHPVETKKKKALYAIGFAVYEIPHSMARVTPHFVIDQKPLDVTNHSVAREVVTFFTLPPGDYIVLPQTNVPNCDGKFLLRILTDEQSNICAASTLSFHIRSNTDAKPKALIGQESAPKPPTSPERLQVEVNEDNMVFRNITSEFLEEAPLLPSLELCKSLIMLRDYNISGRINLMDIPVLMHMLHFWRIAFQKFDRVGHGTKTSSYNLRALLWEAGSTASNKVLECLVLRFSKSKILTSECFVMAMVRLHLAHDDPNDHLLLTILMAAVGL
uniref:(California timema) hypothetical protein n=1 Tax=Timema californicum TaxID=61474 RepID=A0A7R9IWN6_TIMCA|nr:unnamed protein product [Timema californicum]